MYDNNMLLDSGAHHYLSLDAAPSDPALYDNHLKHLPNDIQDYCGVPLLQMQALYGYTFNGKLLYEECFETIIATMVIEEGSIVAKAGEAPADSSSPMAQSKRGVRNPSGVPGKSHVCSNIDETAPRSATVSFALDFSSNEVSSVQRNHSPRLVPK